MVDAPEPVNEADLDWEERTHGEAFEMHRKRLGVEAGGEALGCSLYEVPPGACFGPYHYHTGNEEAIYVLEGQGTVRTPSDRIEITEGDYVAFPRGERGAHQVTNDSADPLRYLCTSTMREPDVVVYPDSEKYNIAAGAAPGRPLADRSIAKIFQAGSEVDYWHDEG